MHLSYWGVNNSRSHTQTRENWTVEERRKKGRHRHALTLKYAKHLVFIRLKTIYEHICKWQWTHRHTKRRRHLVHSGAAKRNLTASLTATFSLSSAAKAVCICLLVCTVSGCACLQVCTCAYPARVYFRCACLQTAGRFFLCFCPCTVYVSWYVLNFSSKAHGVENIIPCRYNLLQLYVIWWWSQAQGTCTVLSRV